MIKNGLAEGMVTRKLCVEVLDLVLTSFRPRFRPRFFQHQRSQKSKSLTCCYLVPRFSVTPYLVPIGKVDLKKKMFPSTSYSFLFQIKAAAHIDTKTGYIKKKSPFPNLHFVIFVLVFRGVQNQKSRQVTIIPSLKKGDLGGGSN